MAMRSNDPDNFEIVRRTVLGRLRVSNVLTDRIFVRKKFFGHLFVDDGNAPAVLVFALRLSEIAATQKLYTDGVEVAGTDRSVERTRAQIRCLRIGRKRVSDRHDATRVGEVSIWQHRSDCTCLNT